VPRPPVALSSIRTPTPSARASTPLVVESGQPSLILTAFCECSTSGMANICDANILPSIWFWPVSDYKHSVAHLLNILRPHSVLKSLNPSRAIPSPLTQALGVSRLRHSQAVVATSLLASVLSSSSSTLPSGKFYLPSNPPHSKLTYITVVTGRIHIR
jgi:hypothetical protein